MKSLVEYTEFIVKSVCKNPDMVKVQIFESDEEDTILEIIVHSDDMATVIGRNGKMISAIRTLIQAYCALNNQKRVKVNVDSF